MFSFFKKKPDADTRKSDPRVFPRLRGAEYIARLKAAGYRSEQLPLAEPLVGDILLLFGIDEETTFQLITPSDATSLGLSLDALRELAMANCAAVLGKMVIHTNAAVHRLTAPNATAGCRHPVSEDMGRVGG